MANKKTIIHVGLQKTASTFLQKDFFPKLNDVTYIGRPYTQLNHAFNSLQYADQSIYSHSATKKEFESITKLSKHDTILISDELFSGYAFYNFYNRGTIAERLSKVVPDAEIILFLRAQPDLIVSLYNQYVKIGWFCDPLNKSFLHKSGEGFSIDEWLEGKRDWDVSKRFINHRSLFISEHFVFSKIYSLYESLFKKVHVFLYEDFKTDPISCLRRLESIVSKKPSPLINLESSKERVINKSLNENQLRTRIIENRIKYLSPNSHSKFIKFLSSRLSKLFFEDISVKNNEYVLSILKESEIAKDNLILNDKIGLGMDKYSDKYFSLDI